MKTIEIVDYLATELGHPFNHVLKQKLKHDLLGYRSLYIKQDIERNQDINNFSFKQRFNLELDNVENLDNCFKVLDCTTKRTINEVPLPVKRKNMDIFNFVGSSNKPFQLTDINNIEFLKYRKYDINLISYSYINNFIYVFNQPKLKYLTIEGIFEEPEKVLEFCSKDKCESDNCYNDDNDFPCSLDMIRRIEDTILNNKLKYINLQNDLEVKHTENE